ncbi:MAG: hypothetical protein QOG45_2700, partial [Chloroflexota bacterium]|nr:hypothetical protein [Chloroflexota bacterium]
MDGIAAHPREQPEQRELQHGVEDLRGHVRYRTSGGPSGGVGFPP